MGYRADLEAVPSIYRQQLRRYVEAGYVPQNRVLLAVLSGRVAEALKMQERREPIRPVLDFLTAHVSPTAWGSSGAVAKYSATHLALSKLWERAS